MIIFLNSKHLNAILCNNVRVGLQRQSTAARHAKMLGIMLPSSFKYAYLSGLWSLDPAVSNPSFGAESLHRALYGAASSDDLISLEDKFSARVEYMKALGGTGNYSYAALEAAILAKDIPLIDFQMLFMMRDVHQLTDSIEIPTQCSLQDDSCSTETIDWKSFYAKEKDMKAFYQLVSRLATNDYAGYRPAQSSWKPQEFPSMMSSAEFRAFVRRREPFIISFGDLQSMSAGLGWGIHRWTNLTYLLNKVVFYQVEVVVRINIYTFCFCLGRRRGAGLGGEEGIGRATIRV